MIFNTGWSVTRVENRKQSIPVDGISTAWFEPNYPAGLPFGHLRIALNNYIAKPGVRAVLWHQGETDNLIGTNQGNYVNNLRSVISESRAFSGKPNLTWIVIRASWYNYISTCEKVRNSHILSSIIAAQNDVIGVGTKSSDPAYKLNGVFEGPETDQYRDSRYKSDSVHISGTGLLYLAQLWIDRFTDNFILNSNLYSAIPISQININPANSTSLPVT